MRRPSRVPPLHPITSSMAVAHCKLTGSLSTEAICVAGIEAKQGGAMLIILIKAG